MAQPKKHASTRARANKAPTAATLKSSGEEIPAMPEVVEWHPEAVAWWDDVWSSPMSPEWDDSDIHNVTICALLYNDVWLAESASDRQKAAAEFRLQRKDLGLTPYDRRRLEWSIESAENAKDSGKARRSRQGAKQPSQADDPRLRLVQ